MKKDKYTKFSTITRIPCPHCSNLCSSNVQSCPKCGESLPDLKSSGKTLSPQKDEKYNEFNYLELLSAEIGKDIPLREKIKSNEVGYKIENGKITGISLPGCRLKSLPPLHTPLPSLKVLFLNQNRFKTVPAEIKYMTSLERLRLDHNQLEILTSEINKNSTLRVLKLDSNNISEVPIMDSLESLEFLSLSRNNIKNIHNSIGFLSNLKYLNLRINKIERIPDSINFLINLKKLNLSSNDLKTIPENIGNLKSLEYLYLSNNNLKNLPRSLANLIKLKELGLKGNFWITPPSFLKNLKAKGLIIKH
ncbi:MAG: hypothetical protein EU548_08490 [Promethearchaeota archaeon]|nr:MAG: hypothetical protein EU548_08490 [Candidatus Lokiarchaeota archaeon]